MGQIGENSVASAHETSITKMISSTKPGPVGGDEMSSPEDSHSANANSRTGPVSTDARVTPGQIRDSLGILVRQIVIFVRTTILNAGHHGQIWWRDYGGPGYYGAPYR